LISVEPFDTDLVFAAQAGDTASLGVLIERHRAGMQAVALSVLGYGPDAEDAVQDASLVALRRIDGLRDPTAAGPWLRTIVRNACRMRLRASSTSLATALPDAELPSREPTPDELLDRRATRDWVWCALEGLSEPVRLVALLRYFSDVTSYDQIAALCGIPVGTVRSRLNQARIKLTEGLKAAAADRHGDAASFTAARRRDAEEVLRAARNGEFATVVREGWCPDVSILGPGGERGKGQDFVIRAMDRDLAHGVRQRLTNVIASADILIWEAELTAPADDPYCCQPAVVWLQTLHQRRVRSLRLFHPG
jgi:RNA polymerase sigma-70 factor (ECF subfamily)